MFQSILAAVAAALTLISKLFGDSGKADQRELGRAEQQNADMKADVGTIRAANEAAKKAEEGGDDPNDLDRAR